MTVLHYQANSVIRTYMKYMKTSVDRMGDKRVLEPRKDVVVISEEGMRRMFFERVGEQMTDRLKKYDQNE
jgi:hypothetical protein